MACRILDKDPATRMTVSEALAHPWISQEFSAPTTQLSSVVLSRLQSFTRTTRLERLLLNVAAHQLTSKEIDRLGAMFRALDHDDDGCGPQPWFTLWEMLEVHKSVVFHRRVRGCLVFQRWRPPSLAEQRLE